MHVHVQVKDIVFLFLSPFYPLSLSLSLSPSLLPSSPHCHIPRLVEKARHRQQAISRASASVTDRMFIQQVELKKHFIDHIAGATTCERDMLQQWRTVIQLNTHPRSVMSTRLRQ